MQGDDILKAILFYAVGKEIRYKISDYCRYLLLLHLDWTCPYPRHIRRKKRYVYLVLENVGNFQIGYKDSIVVLTL